MANRLEKFLGDFTIVSPEEASTRRVPEVNTYSLYDDLVACSTGSTVEQRFHVNYEDLVGALGDQGVEDRHRPAVIAHLVRNDYIHFGPPLGTRSSAELYLTEKGLMEWALRRQKLNRP